MINYKAKLNISFLFYAFCFVAQSLLRNPYLCLLPLIRLIVKADKSTRLDVLIGSFSALLLLEPGSGLNSSEIQASPALLRYVIMATVFISSISFTSQPISSTYIIPPLFILASIVSTTFSVRQYFSLSEACTQFLYICVIFVLATRKNYDIETSTLQNISKSLYLLGCCYSSMLIIQYFSDTYVSSSFSILSSSSELKFFPLLSSVTAWYFFGYLKSIPMFFLALFSLAVQMSRTSFICLILFFIICTTHYFLVEIKSLVGFKIRILPLVVLAIIAFAGAIGLASVLYEEAPIKTLGFIYKLVEKSAKNEFDFQVFLYSLDPVRAFEWETWLGSGIKQFFVGSGLGTGASLVPIMHLSASTLEGSFTTNELTERVAFGFHDIFTWYGISIGILGLAVLSWPFMSSNILVVKSKRCLDVRNVIFSIGMLLALANGWYSLSAVMLLSSINSITSRHITSS